MARCWEEWLGQAKVEYEDPVAVAIFAPAEDVRGYSANRMFDLIMRTADNDRLTDAEFRRFVRSHKSAS
jgi:hypothetical protein